MPVRFGRLAVACGLGALLLALFGAARVRAAEGEGGALAQMELADEPKELLAGRLTIRLPEFAEENPLWRGPNAVPESTFEETRYALETWSGRKTQAQLLKLSVSARRREEHRTVEEKDKEKLVLMAYETFELAGDDFARKLAGEAESWGRAQECTYLVQPLEGVGEGLRAWVVVPSRLEANQEAPRIMQVYVVSPDRTIQLLEFYANRRGAADRAGCIALAQRIAKSVAKGNRELYVKGGGRMIFRATEREDLLMLAPEGYASTLQLGPEMMAHYLHQLHPFLGPVNRMGVYLGKHAAYQYEQGRNQPQVVKTEGRILGKKVEWHSWSFRKDKSTTVYMREAILPLPGAESAGVKLHVFLQAEELPELDLLQHCGQSIRIARRKEGEPEKKAGEAAEHPDETKSEQDKKDDGAKSGKDDAPKPE